MYLYKKNFKLWLLMPIFIISFFIFVKNINAYDETPIWEYPEMDFEDQTAGTISTTSEQALWWKSAGDNGASYVSEAACYGGSGKCIKFVHDASQVKRNYQTENIVIPFSPDIYSFYIKVTDDLDPNKIASVCFDFTDDHVTYSGNSGFGIQIKNNDILFNVGNCGLISTSGASVILDTFTISQWYKISLRVGQTFAEVKIDNGDWETFSKSNWDENYIGGRMIIGQQVASNGTWYLDDFSWQTYTVSVIDLPDWTGTVEISSEKIEVDEYQTCFINETCTVDVRYSYADINKVAYIFDSDDFSEDEIDYDLAYDQQTLTASGSLKISLDVENVSYSQSKDYYILIENTDFTIDTYQVHIDWLENIDYFTDWNCDTICDDIATSTDDNFFDGVRAGFECAFRKISCWGVKPDEDSLIQFSKAKLALEKSFPFSIYNQVLQTIQYIDIASSTESTLEFNFSTFGLPLNENIIVASSTAMSDNFGNFWDLFYTLLEKIIYVLIFIYFITRIFYIALKN